MKKNRLAKFRRTVGSGSEIMFWNFWQTLAFEARGAGLLMCSARDRYGCNDRGGSICAASVRCIVRNTQRGIENVSCPSRLGIFAGLSVPPLDLCTTLYMCCVLYCSHSRNCAHISTLYPTMLTIHPCPSLFFMYSQKLSHWVLKSGIVYSIFYVYWRILSAVQFCDPWTLLRCVCDFRNETVSRALARQTGRRVPSWWSTSSRGRWA